MIKKSIFAFVAATVICTSAKAITDNEIVAACIIFEAGGEGDVGMQAVANVINNRAKAKSKSTKSIVLQRWQFSCFNAHTIDGEPLDPIIAKAKNHPHFEKALKLASQKDLEDITGGASHYHVFKGRSKVTPYWTHPDLGGKNQKAIITVKIGSHVFLRNVD